MSDPSQSPKKRPNKWFALINIPIQMGVIVFAFAWGGNWLDEKYPNAHNIYVKILTLVGVALAFYNINRQLKDINKSDDNEA
jgi:F0F1-type ATP synthase assembly protein I